MEKAAVKQELVITKEELLRQMDAFRSKVCYFFYKRTTSDEIRKMNFSVRWFSLVFQPLAIIPQVNK